MMLQCVQGKKLLDKTHNAFQNLTHVEKLFNPPSTSSIRAFGSLFCVDIYTW